MRLRFLAVLLSYAGWLCVCLSPIHCPAAPTVWSGLTISFSKPNNANYELPEFQDRITGNVWLTRDVTAGLLNYQEEDFYSSNSPLGTRWATVLNNPGKTIAATNWSDLSFSSG